MKPRTVDIALLRLSHLPADIEDLREEAAAQGFRFVDRLVAEWRSGANRFAGPGEILLGAFMEGRLIAVGGLDKDPYTDEVGIGRLRHLYVRNAERRSGVGSALVRQLVRSADASFHMIRLRTETREGAAFYARLGFRAVRHPTATHLLRVRP